MFAPSIPAIIIFFIIPSLIPIILGIVALYDIRKRKLSGKKRAIFAIAMGCFYVLILVIIPFVIGTEKMLLLGSRPSSGSTNRPSVNNERRANAEVNRIDQMVRLHSSAVDIQDEFVQAMIRRDGEATREIAQRFSRLNVSSFPADYRVAHQQLATAMAEHANSLAANSRARTSEERLSAVSQLVRTNERLSDALGNFLSAWERWQDSMGIQR